MLDTRKNSSVSRNTTTRKSSDGIKDLRKSSNASRNTRNLDVNRRPTDYEIDIQDHKVSFFRRASNVKRRRFTLNFD